MKVLAPFKVEHAWCRGKQGTIRHTFEILALGLRKRYWRWQPKGFANLGAAFRWERNGFVVSRPFEKRRR